MTTCTAPSPVDLSPAGHGALDCVMALETTITQDCPREPDGVKILAGPHRRLSLAASPRGLAAAVAGDLTPAERVVIGDELRQLGTVVQPGPMVLEQLLDRGDGQLVHIIIRALPIDTGQKADLVELLTGTAELEAAHDLAWEYTEEIAAACRDGLPDRRLPVHDLADYDPRAHRHGAPGPRGLAVAER